MEQDYKLLSLDEIHLGRIAILLDPRTEAQPRECHILAVQKTAQEGWITIEVEFVPGDSNQILTATASLEAPKFHEIHEIAIESGTVHSRH